MKPVPCTEYLVISDAFIDVLPNEGKAKVGFFAVQFNRGGENDVFIGNLHRCHKQFTAVRRQPEAAEIAVEA